MWKLDMCCAIRTTRRGIPWITVPRLSLIHILEGELLVTAINNTDHPLSCALSGNAVRDLLNDKVFEGIQNTTVVEIPPFSAMILEEIN